MMNKQEVIRYIRNLLTKELNEAARDSWISKKEGTKLQNTHSDILNHLEYNLDDSVRKSPLQLSEENRKINNVELKSEFPLEPGIVIIEENIRRIVRDEIHKVLRKEQHLQK